MFAELLLTLVTILLLWFILENYFPARKYAPGPFRLPLIGSALSLILNRSTPPFILFQEFSKRYGPVCYISTGQRKMVIIDDFETAKQILNHETWVNRPYNQRIGERSFGKPLGIIFVNGDSWKEMRRFSMRTLRDFGYGKQTSMQAVLDEEVKALISKVELIATCPEPIMEIKHLFTMPVLNILWSMVSNVRTAEDDVKLRKLIKLVDNLAKANPIGGNILSIFPFLRFVFPVWTGHTMAQKCHKELQEYFRDILERRRSEGSYNDDKRDFIDTFIQEIDRHSKIGSNPNHYTDEQFITTITDLFEG
ncbi:unnamed protein product [Orchesella dallaii]|uniref:Cytochrome P450 n=1 Tax=Orchesella dallaii TaxID=48710 RepID=A0ABP1PNS8_9HEXA